MVTKSAIARILIFVLILSIALNGFLYIKLGEQDNIITKKDVTIKEYENYSSALNSNIAYVQNKNTLLDKINEELESNFVNYQSYYIYFNAADYLYLNAGSEEISWQETEREMTIVIEWADKSISELKNIAIDNIDVDTQSRLTNEINFVEARHLEFKYYLEYVRLNIECDTNTYSHGYCNKAKDDSWSKVAKQYDIANDKWAVVLKDHGLEMYV